jgi:hypothetical protein
VQKRISLVNFLSPDRSIIRYVVGTAALTVAIQFLYDLSKETFALSGATALAAVLIALVLLMFWWDVRRAQQGSEIVPKMKPIDPHRGLILLVSPGNLEVPLKAIEHHQERLEHCWLLASNVSLSTADELVRIVHQRWPQVEIVNDKNRLVDPEDLESTWQRVREIYTKLGPEVNLSAGDIIADITGGTKPMTAGMAFACLDPDRDMEYMYVPRNPEDGTPASDRLVPMLIRKERAGRPGAVQAESREPAGGQS